MTSLDNLLRNAKASLNFVFTIQPVLHGKLTGCTAEYIREQLQYRGKRVHYYGELHGSLVIRSATKSRHRL